MMEFTENMKTLVYHSEEIGSNPGAETAFNDLRAACDDDTFKIVVERAIELGIKGPILWIAYKLSDRDGNTLGKNIITKDAKFIKKLNKEIKRNRLNQQMFGEELYEFVPEGKTYHCPRCRHVFSATPKRKMICPECKKPFI